MVVVEHPRSGYLRAGLCRCVLFAGVLVSSSMTDRRHKEGICVETISQRVLQIDSQLLCPKVTAVRRAVRAVRSAEVSRFHAKPDMG